MHISKIGVKNFRLLSAVEMKLETGPTVVVGRNNSGKTSLSDVIRKFLDERAKFNLEDFSSACYDGFCAALHAWIEKKDDDIVRALIPYIELRIHITYDPAVGQYGPLSDFVIDFDVSCTEAVVICRYALKAGRIADLFVEQENASFHTETQTLNEHDRVKLFTALRQRVPVLFEPTFTAQEPNDPNNSKAVSHAALSELMSTDFINAQRGVDGVTSRDVDVLAKVLEGLFASAALPTAEGDPKTIAETLNLAVEGIQAAINKLFNEQLTKLIPTIEQFGYPGLEGPDIQTETTLEINRLLSNHTKVQYAGYSGVHLPESYSGLGFRNLLFILLRIISFHREYQTAETAPVAHLVFIEEPEAHLHPQMQDVFIRHLTDISKTICKDYPGETWPVQFIVSTHSSHVANEAEFEAIRYFIVSSKDQPVGVRHTKVKDLRSGLTHISPTDKAFLHQYLTLTRCDLFFADKAILIEGTSERLMLPKIIKMMDAADPTLKLATQYVTTLEVGGAYAHLFFPILDFLELRYLIITDIDSGEKNANNKLVKCPVHRATGTSNACLKFLFGKDVEPAQLIAKTDTDKTHGNRRIAFQVPESDAGPCGRTFEDAFILANRALFSLVGTTREELEASAADIAGDSKKSEFALEYAIKQTTWTTPTYILGGLRWLAGGPAVATVDPGLALLAAAKAAEGSGGATSV